jgi:pimeloyl-ACP methyl ester carboxylesterase
MHSLVATVLLTGMLAGSAQAQPPVPVAGKPMIVLVHGALADSSSWNGMVKELARDGYPIVAAALSLRSLKGDADYVTSLVSSIPGPVVLV